ncbi:MAG: tetraacyldisaccharide 4'-kinase [Bacteroidota bacterium]
MRKKHRNFFEYFLYPLSILYGMVVGLRNKFFDYSIIQSKEFDIPVISVGNITVGGTGKTPHVEYLISILKNDFNIATLSRGYKRKTSDFRIASLDSTATEIGDEPRQIKRKFPDIEVAVDKKRARGIQELTRTFQDLNAIILDDAYQHRYVKPGISILLIDYNRLITRDYLLPFGRLREKPYEKRRANIILITKCPNRLKPIEKRLVIKDLNLFPYQNLYFTSYEYGDILPVFPGEANAMQFREARALKPSVLLITGIANPRMLKRHVRGITTRITELSYPDHYSFKEKDIQLISKNYKALEGDEKLIITSEKDAMRLQEMEDIPPDVKSSLYYIPVKVVILDDQEKKFNQQIINYVRSNKPVGKLFT